MLFKVLGHCLSKNLPTQHWALPVCASLCKWPIFQVMGKSNVIPKICISNLECMLTEYFAFLNFCFCSFFQRWCCLGNQWGGRCLFRFYWMCWCLMVNQMPPHPTCLTPTCLCWPATWTCCGWLKLQHQGQHDNRMFSSLITVSL